MKIKRALLTVLLFICLGVAGFSAYKLITTALEYKQSSDEYEDLKKYTADNVSPLPTQTPEPTPVPEEPDINEPTPEPTPAPEPEASERPPIAVDCDQLAAINPDFAGWIYLGAEDISYPIVHTTDNDYYLHRTFENTYNFAGSIFMETQNRTDLSDPHTIIYGHNMKNESMFGKLKYLLNREDYKLDDTFWIITRDHAFKYKIFSIAQTESDSGVYTLFTGPGPEIVEYIRACERLSAVKFEPVECDENSRVVTLSTCVAAEGDARLVVQGILVSEV